MYVLQEGEFASVDDTYPYEDPHPWFFEEGTGQTAACAPVGTDAGAEDLFRHDLRDTLVYIKEKTERQFYLANKKIVAFVGTSGNEMPLLPPELIYEEHEIDDLLNEEDETEEDNYFDYLVWQSDNTLSNFHECLIVDEMNFHCEQMRDLVLSEQPPGTDVIVDINVGHFTTVGAAPALRQHLMAVWYADRVPNEQEVLSLPGGE